jgi:nucleoside-diphosphate-sugar epimerase
MLKVLPRGISLPLGAVFNRRSLIYFRNRLMHAVVLRAIHPVASETYLVIDGEEVSGDFAQNWRSPRCPREAAAIAPVLRLGGTILGKAGAVERLLGSLIVDRGKIRRELGWIPPFTVTEGLQKTAEWFKSNHV